MMGSGNGVDGVGVESYASSGGHGMTVMAWQSQTAASSCAAPMQRYMDCFAWASVSRTTALADDSPAAASGGPPQVRGFQSAPPAAAGFEHFPVDWVRSSASASLGGGNGTTNAGAFDRVHVTGHGDALSAGAAAAGGGASGVPAGSQKRRRSHEVVGTDQANTSNASADSADETEHGKGGNGEETGPAARVTATSRSRGKGGEPQKEGYVHVRARSGQATNSHSLAEKLRREKISERMKLLQDLVPGCSKVTGKAVMLDEIINYVQSLQRQVEFLSMKLSTVNPRLDLNIESILAKDILRVPWSPSTTPIGFSFSQEMMSKPSQSGMLQGGVLGMANSDMFRTVMQSFSQEPASQIHHALDGSFDDEAQMAYPRLLIGSEDLSTRRDQDAFRM